MYFFHLYFVSFIHKKPKISDFVNVVMPPFQNETLYLWLWIFLASWLLSLFCLVDFFRWWRWSLRLGRRWSSAEGDVGTLLLLLLLSFFGSIWNEIKSTKKNQNPCACDMCVRVSFPFRFFFVLFTISINNMNKVSKNGTNTEWFIFDCWFDQIWQRKKTTTTIWCEWEMFLLMPAVCGPCLYFFRLHLLYIWPPHDI